MGFQNYEMVLPVGAVPANGVASKTYVIGGNIGHLWHLVGSFNSTISIQTSFDGGATWVTPVIDLNGNTVLAFPDVAFLDLAFRAALVTMRWVIVAFGTTLPRVFYAGVSVDGGGAVDIANVRVTP